jgi:hypothetical protein
MNRLNVFYYLSFCPHACKGKGDHQSKSLESRKSDWSPVLIGGGFFFYWNYFFPFLEKTEMNWVQRSI